MSAVFTDGHQGARQGRHGALPGVPISNPSCAASPPGASLRWAGRAGCSPACADISAVAELLGMKYEFYVDVI